MDTTKTTTHIGLCAGYGGIELGLKRVIPNLRSVALCEIEAFACANLVAKMEAGLMEPAPIWTDLKSFPWESFRDRVDILTGGYPCQPFSAAGKRLGTEDPRHLWPFIASGIRILRPKLCFFENVEGHISLGLREVIGELEQMGYKVSWGIFSAREVGAPHQRKRVFILAMANNGGEGLQGDISRLLVSSRRQEQGGSVGSCCGSSGDRELADTNGAGSRQDWKSSESRTDCIEQSSVIEGRSESGQIREGQAWPSRPGEPQHDWEPPRVVANNHRPHAGHGEQRPERTLGDLSGGCGEGSGNMANSNSNEPSEGRGDNAEVSKVSSKQWKDECSTISGGESEFSGEEVLGNAAAAGLQGCGTSSEMDRKSGGAESEGSESTPSIALSSDAHGGEAMGNALLTGSSPERPNRGQQDGLGQPSGGTMGNAHSPRPQDRTGQRGAGIQGTNANGGADAERQAQPALGGDADGSSDRLDYAELQVSCDNRTDELRLLGNGVVPATAERAFRTLLSELNT